MPGALAALLEHQRAPDTVARAEAEGGRKVIGYIDETVPRELIAAAGFLPHRLSGDPALEGDIFQRYVHPLAPKGFSAARTHDVEHVNALIAKLLAGRYDFLDRLVISNTRKAILLVQHKLEQARAHFPGMRLPPTHVLDRAQTATFASGLFNRARVYAFQETLAGWSGCTIGSDALIAAIEDENATRARLRRVRVFRAAARLTGTEALALYAAAKTMPGVGFRAMADAAYNEIEARPARDSVRLFFAGSPVNHPLWAEAIERSAALLVGDDQSWGDAGAEDDIPLDGNPMEALIAHYEALNPLVQPLEAQVARLTAMVRSCKADAAVLAVYRGDDIKLWEMPDQIAALETAGIPTLYLKEQDYRPPDDLTDRVRAFVASLGDRR